MTDKEKLVDISAIEVTESLVAARLVNYVKRVKNPYRFRVKNTAVKVTFSSDPAAPAIETALVNIVNARSD